MYSHYSVVTGASFSINGALVELVREVKEVMRHGWEPMGGAIYCGQETIKGSTNHVFAQTVVKHPGEGVPPITAADVEWGIKTAQELGVMDAEEGIDVSR